MFNSYQKYFFCATFLLVLSLTPAGNALSDEPAESEQIPSSKESLPTLPQVTVLGERPAPTNGSTSIDKETIGKLPSRNGNITDILNIVPGVQLSEEANNSFTAGEIAPSEISISGGRIYENNFLIDGISNNNISDPTPDNPANPNLLPGHSQSMFLNTRLIEQITVYDHNIPARFGGFIGGVVESKTKDPGVEFSGGIDYQQTRDAWTKFHIAEEDRDDFYNSYYSSKQPRFKKQIASMDVNIPLSLNSGLIFAYALTYSEIPLNNLDFNQSQYRRSDNYFLKYVLEPSSRSKLSLSTIYAPYEEIHFLRKTNNSEFTTGGDSTLLLANYEVNGLAGKLDLKIGFQKNVNDRKAPSQLTTWLSNIDDVPTSKSWGLSVGSNTSKEGGFGNLNLNQETTSILGDWTSKPVIAGWSRQILSIGFSIERTTAEFKRDVSAFAYSSAKAITDGTPCIDGDPACITGEQYLSKRITYPAGDSSILGVQYTAYLDDQIYVKDIFIRPGVRISKSTLTDKANIAPRLAATYKIFEKYDTTLTGGVNRYYSQNLLSYKLREATSPIVIDKRVAADEAFPGLLEEYALPATRFSTLKTPYSDEVCAGFSQPLFSSLLTFDYVRRDNNDQLAKEKVISDEGSYYILNNNGSSTYESYRLAWEKQWPTQILNMNVAYQNTLSSNSDYDDRLEDYNLLEQVIYKGEILYRDELPRKDYNRPWTVNLTYSKTFNDKFTFTNVTRYLSHYRSIEDSGDENIEGLAIYEDVVRPSIVTFDWKLSQSIPLGPNYVLALNLDIFNVFNRKNYVATYDDRYGLGRQIWLGAELTF